VNEFGFHSFQFSKDGNHVFCVRGVVVKVLNVQNGDVHQTIGQEEDPEVTCFALSPDDETLVVASQNSLLKQYNWKENVIQRTWKVGAKFLSFFSDQHWESSSLEPYTPRFAA
jgi:WD40 repeat protein